MPTFRAYLLDKRGRIVWGDWLEAADLAEAKEKAGQLCREGAPTVEIWEGPRHLADLDCATKTEVEPGTRKGR